MSNFVLKGGFACLKFCWNATKRSHFCFGLLLVMKNENHYDNPKRKKSYLFSLAASKPFSMSEKKEVQLLPLASLISFLFTSLVALYRFHNSCVLPLLARLNLSLVSLRSFSSFPFYQWVSCAFLIFACKQLSSYVVIMATKNRSATLSRASTSLISMVFSCSAACRSVE